MPRAQLMARDLRRAALHEFGHLHVAHHYGVAGHVRIRLNPTAGDGLTERFFVGRFHLLQTCTDPVIRRHMGLAGVIAEEMDTDDSVEGWSLLDALEYGSIELSSTDAEFAGDYDEADIDAVIALLRKCWPAVQRDVAFEVQGWAEEVAA